MLALCFRVCKTHGYIFALSQLLVLMSECRCKLLTARATSSQLESCLSCSRLGCTATAVCFQVFTYVYGMFTIFAIQQSHLWILTTRPVPFLSKAVLGRCKAGISGDGGMEMVSLMGSDDRLPDLMRHELQRDWIESYRSE